MADEMFNNTVAYMGDWKAMKHEPPLSDGSYTIS